MIAAPMNVANIFAPSLSWSRGVSFVIVAKTTETKNANTSIRPKWLVIYLRPRRTS